MSDMTPREIVHELNRHIVGQEQAKRSVAIALRNRWRRMQLDDVLRPEVTPKNILMIGPTGVGKTEIARRLARLANAPFIKVEATKFTEVGYVGRDVETIVRDLVEMAVKAIKHARKYTSDVEFSCEDAGRTHIDYLCRMVEAAINAGATTVNIPDTVGYTIPSEFGGIISTLFNRVPNIDKAVISVHCHNDLGLAVANSLAAVEQGARQVECTINGIGERAGNCSLEEIAMTLKTREQLLNLTTGIRSQEISKASKLVSQLCNMPVQANKAIVGANAFSHSSGIHQDGVLKGQNTYEIMTPESVGINKNVLNLTSRSGRHVIKHRLGELGYGENEYNLDDVYASFLRLADKKGQVFDYDLEAILFFDQQKHEDAYYRLSYLSANSGQNIIPSATVTIEAGKKSITQSAIGNGPVDAAYNAIIKAIDGDELEIVDFKLDSKGEGADALAQVSVIVEYKHRRFNGIGLATDIVEAGVKAFIFVLNNMHLADKIDQQKQEKITGV